MSASEVAALIVSLLALGISVATAALSFVAYKRDQQRQRVSDQEKQPYFVIRGLMTKSLGGVWEPSVMLANEGGASAIQIIARSWDPTVGEETTYFIVHHARLAPGESVNVTHLFFESMDALRRFPEFWGNRWRVMRVELGYRLPHKTESFVAFPLIDLESFRWGAARFLKPVDEGPS